MHARTIFESVVNDSGGNMTIILQYCSRLGLAILEDNDLSRSQLTVLLGYTSKTSVDRIIQQKVGERALTDFYERVSRKPELLQKAHSRHLYERVSEILGNDSGQEWLRLLTGSSQADEPFMIALENGQTADFFETYKDRKNLSVRVLGGLSSSFVSALRRLMEQTDCRCTQYIRHTDSTLHLSSVLRCLFPVLFFQKYEGFTYDAGFSDDIRLELPYNIMRLTYDDEAGKQTSDICIFTGNRSCRKVWADMEYDLSAIIRFTGLNVQPINSKILSEMGNNYVSYLHFCEKLELNGNIYQFKNDFGIEQIPAAILNDALREGSFLDDPDAGPFFSEMIAIMGRRNENTSKRENEYYSVFRESALRKFASTGIMSDHFWGMRSFTPEERIAIFRRIIRRMEDEPNYHLFLLDETHSFTESEITLYGEECLSMIKPHTTYSPAEEHFEILIQQRDYCSSFRVFFLRQMIPQYTKNERASLRKIKGILAELRQELKQT